MIREMEMGERMKKEEKDQRGGLFSRRKTEPSKMPCEQNSENTYMGNDFIELKNLIYAPLEALAESNFQLQRSTLRALQEMGTLKKDGDESIIHLKTTNLAYEHIKPEQDDGYSVENIQLQVPTISLIPLNNLAVKKAEIDFSTEIHVNNDEENSFQIYARICSPEQRKTDFFPKVSYKMKVESLPATEGFLRILDMLGSSQVGRQLENKMILPDGSIQSEEMQKLYQDKMVIRNRINSLQTLYKTITNRIMQIQNMSDSLETDMPKAIEEKLEALQALKTEIMEELMYLELDLTEKDVREQNVFREKEEEKNP